MAAKPLPPPRAVFHEARLREVWDLVTAGSDGATEGGDGSGVSLSFAVLKRQLDDLEVDFGTCGLDTAKINRAVFQTTETDPDMPIDFVAFCAFAARMTARRRAASTPCWRRTSTLKNTSWARFSRA